MAPLELEDLFDKVCHDKIEDGILRLNQVLSGELRETPGTVQDVVTYINSWIEFVAMGDCCDLTYKVEENGVVHSPSWLDYPDYKYKKKG